MCARSAPMSRRSSATRKGSCGPGTCASASGLPAPPSNSRSPPRCRSRSDHRAMYLYDEFDRTLLAERVSEFRGQVGRRLTGELNDDEFNSLRLMNGVYLQLHAYMLRIAIPYGTLASDQMRKLALVARRYDRGYGHFTTRQNIQFN